MRRRTPEQPEPVGEANVLPVLNIMFLLIPALLLAMEVASMASVTVSAPHTRAGEESSEPTKPKEALELQITILGDGFRVRSNAQQHGAEPGQAQASDAPSIRLAQPDAPMSHYDRYDYAALEDLARELKTKHPDETVVRVSAENDIPAQVLINTLDALRGTDCRPAINDEDHCLFIHPVVEAS